MTEELINFDLPTNKSSIIKVLGIGGGGGNAVNYMFEQGIKDVDFVVCNTDAQALIKSPVPIRIQLGTSLTEGRGAGSKPEQGREAAIENLDDVLKAITDNTKMIFITACMGGGTGTGAAPIIAKAVKDLGILTVAIVTIPFRAEGPIKIENAINGIAEIKEYVDSLLVINNERLREIYGNLSLTEAWSKADNILSVAAKGIAEVITIAGHINVDFADVETVMKDSGIAIMGQGVAEGENRAVDAIKEALTSPLLNNNDIKGAKNILLNITSGVEEITLDELSEISEYAQDAAGNKANIIFGSCKDEKLNEQVAVTIIATGFDASSIPELHSKMSQEKKVVGLENVHHEPSNIQQNNEEFAISQKTLIFEEKEDKTEIDHLHEFYKSKPESEKTDKKEQIDSQADTEETNTVYDLMDPDNIDDIEKTPAYKRNQQNINNKNNYSEKSEVSKYTLKNENDETSLNDSNSFLYDNVD